MPKFTSLDLTVLLGVTGAKTKTPPVDLTAALARLKNRLADLARTDSRTNELLPLALLFALSRRRGGGGGAPAELGLPRAPSVSPAPIAAAQYHA